MKQTAFVAAVLASAAAGAQAQADTFLGGTTSTRGNCIAPAYSLMLTIEGANFRATVRREGGGQDGATFEITGTVDAANHLAGTVLGGVQTTGFSGDLSGDSLTGTSVAPTCSWSYALNRHDCAPFSHDELLLEGFSEEDLAKFCS